MIKQIWVIPVKFFGFEIFRSNVEEIKPCRKGLLTASSKFEFL